MKQKLVNERYKSPSFLSNTQKKEGKYYRYIPGNISVTTSINFRK